MELLAFVPFEHLFLMEKIKVEGFAEGIFLQRSIKDGRIACLPKKDVVWISVRQRQ